jgi:hypothetical protein
MLPFYLVDDDAIVPFEWSSKRIEPVRRRLNQ